MIDSGEYCHYDQLHRHEQQRWMMLAKALGPHPYHDHYTPLPRDVQRFGDDRERHGTKGIKIGPFEYDSITHPSPESPKKPGGFWRKLVDRLL